MAMSRKHYREVADMFKAEWENSLTLPKNEGTEVRAALVNLISGMATMFKIDNHLFDRQKFLDACQPEPKPLAPHGTGPNVGLYEGDE